MSSRTGFAPEHRPFASPHVPIPDQTPFEAPAKSPRGFRDRLVTLASLLLLFALGLAPLFLNLEGPPRWMMPQVHTGDEPHYLVILNSALNDGDLDVSNNYASVHEGSWQAGKRFREARGLEHHSNVRTPEGSFPWPGYFELAVPFDRWVRDVPDGPMHPPWAPWAPQFKPYPPGTPEYSIHPSGMAVITPLLFPWKGHPRSLESASLVLTALVVLAAMIGLRQWLRSLGAGNWMLTLVPLAVLAGTPVWFYTRSLYTEGYILACVLGAYSLVLQKRSSLLAGVLLALGLQFKPTVALLALPLFADLFLRRQWRSILQFAWPQTFSVGVMFWMNAFMFGSPLKGPQGYFWGDPWEGFPGLFFSLRHGLLPLSPIALVALICWPRFARNHPRTSLVLGAAIAIQVTLMGFHSFWHGVVYGTRHLVPILPLLFVPLVELPRTLVGREWSGRVLVGAALGVSILINGMAVFYPDRYMHHHPGIEWLKQNEPHWLPPALARLHDEAKT